MSKDAAESSASFYQAVLELGPPWRVVSVNLRKASGQVEVLVEAEHDGALPCEECGVQGPVHDRRKRRWRHLDTCQHQTVLIAQIPRVRCPEHGVRQVHVPWAEPGSRFTMMFEGVVIDWLLEASIKAVAQQCALSWDQVAGIQARAVARGLRRKQSQRPVRLGIDETAFQRRHEYVTVVTDQVAGTVDFVADGRRKESLEAYFRQLDTPALEAIESVSMDMWAPYIAVVEAWVPGAKCKIAFDKFHVAMHLGAAVDKVRRQENRELRAEGCNALTGTKHSFRRNPENMSREEESFLERVRRVALKTARAWALKEHAMCLWSFVRRGWARKAWKAWIGWALRSRLEPMRKVAMMVRKHLEGIVNAIVLRATNAGAESVNAKIQKVKRMSHGFRNRERFRNAIYFHLGGLHLHP